MMTPTRGEPARFTLTDGTTLEGTPKFVWPWSRFYRLEDAVFYDSRSAQPVPAAGFVLIAKRAVVFIQIGD